MPLAFFFNVSANLDPLNLKIVLLLTVGFVLASLFGYCAWWLKLSPILGYLLAGYLIGPYSPGFVADVKMAEQLADIGVILMMFGVGLDFKVHDLWQVRKIAIPGALGQTFLAALLGTAVVYLFGWSLLSGVIIGLSIAVASTVVLVRMLTEHHLLKTTEGHIAVGWLLVEDIITVVILLLLPTISLMMGGSFPSIFEFAANLGWLMLKFIVLAIIILFFAKRCAAYILTRVVKTHSHELFTLATLALVFLITTVTTLFFGISIALGAFMSGMIVRQTTVHHKALIHSLPMRDAFVAVFFLSVGMLFNPEVILNHFFLFIAILLIIIMGKPLTAFLLTLAFKYPMATAFSVAAALAQIGEFSFILAEEAHRFGLMTDVGYDVIIACALISIAINPLMFKLCLKSRESF